MRLTRRNDVDFKTSTIGKLFKQIRKSNFNQVDENSPELMDVWICTITPKFTKSILRFVENHIDRTEQERLHHIKRFKKQEEGSNTLIVTVLCTATYLGFQDLLALLEDDTRVAIESDSLRILRVPKELPLTKEIAQVWSQLIWPMAWKGNPNHQALLTSDLDLEQERRIIETLIDNINDYLKYPFVTVVAQKESAKGPIKILHIAFDERDKHPLHHSIMNAIAMVAQEEEALRRENDPEGTNGYLCQNLLFYTSYEPCAMCAMALVHSRIERLTYLSKHKRGAIESSYFIGDRRDLNWTFDIWRWVGSTDNYHLNHQNQLSQLEP